MSSRDGDVNNDALDDMRGCLFGALLEIALNGKDERARVSAAVYTHKFLSDASAHQARAAVEPDRTKPATVKIV